MIWLLQEELPLCEVGEDGEAEKRARVWKVWITGCFPRGAVPLPLNSVLSAQEDLTNTICKLNNLYCSK